MPPFCRSPQHQHSPLPLRLGPTPSAAETSTPKPLPWRAHSLCPTSRQYTCPTSTCRDAHTPRQTGLAEPSLHLSAHMQAHTLIPFLRRPLSLSGPAPPPPHQPRWYSWPSPAGRGSHLSPLDIAIHKHMQPHQSWQPAAATGWKRTAGPGPPQLHSRHPEAEDEAAAGLLLRRAPRPPEGGSPRAARLTLDPKPSSQQGQDSTPGCTLHLHTHIPAPRGHQDSKDTPEFHTPSDTLMHTAPDGLYTEAHRTQR